MMVTQTVAALESRINNRLVALKSAGLLRSLNPPSGIDLSSNDYLGFASDPYLKARMLECIERLGCGSTGSRLLRGERSEFSALERRFAKFKGSEAALYFSTGYAANLAVLSTFPEPGDLILSDALNHASLRDGIRLSSADKLIIPHNDPAEVGRALASSKAKGQHFVVTESLFSMDGDFAPLREYAAICREAGALLIVDEAHAVGIYGDRGTGLIESAGIGDDVFLSINAAGKALGVGGAFVSGPAWAIDYMVQRARPFVFSTAPPPLMACALDAALDLVEGEPQRRARLLELTRFLRRLLAGLGLKVGPSASQIIPVIIGDNRAASAVASALQAAGFDVRAIRPPTVPEGTARLRLSVNTSLDESILRRFTDSLAAAL